MAVTDFKWVSVNRPVTQSPKSDVEGDFDYVSVLGPITAIETAAAAATQTMPIVSDAGIHSAVFHGLVVSGGQG